MRGVIKPALEKLSAVCPHSHHLIRWNFVCCPAVWEIGCSVKCDTRGFVFNLCKAPFLLVVVLATVNTKLGSSFPRVVVTITGSRSGFTRKMPGSKLTSASCTSILSAVSSTFPVAKTLGRSSSLTFVGSITGNVVFDGEKSTNCGGRYMNWWWYWNFAFGFVLLFCVQELDHIGQHVEVTFVIDLVAKLLRKSRQKNYLQKSSWIRHPLRLRSCWTMSC